MGKPCGKEPRPFSANVHYGENCWEWMSSKNVHGYGQYRPPNTDKPFLAHRVAYETANGPIPPGIRICHRCDNPACVRRDHLFAGTDVDNARDKSSKGRHNNQKKKHCPRGHEYNEENTHIGKSGSRFCLPCRKFR